MTTPTATDVVTLGETMALLRADATGPLQHAGSMRLGVGGSESNVAIALRRLGTPVSWIGRVGEDSLGDLIVRELAAERIDTVAIRDPDAPTGLMLKERRTRHSQQVWYYRSGSAGSRLCVDDLPLERIRTARLLHVTGITPGLSSSAADAVEAALDCARGAGVCISFDLNYRAALWSADAAGEAFRALCKQADVVFAGEDEAALAVGPAPEPATLAHRIADLGPREVVVKLGADGCVAVVGGQEHRQAAIPVEAVDTVGAGDGFVAGYVAELLAGEPVDQRLLTAARVGAFACLVEGDWEGMPRRDELPLLEASEPVRR